MEQENRVRMERIAADPQSGLSAEQVKRRFAQGENNYKVESSTLSVSEIVRSNVCTYFNLVFAVIAVLLAIVGAWSDMLFLPIIVANTCIGIIQEVHSKKVLDKLSILNAPHAVVIRDGKRQEIPADQLVLDDIVEFSAGSQIPADAKVVSGELQVNESLITGESDEIEKREGDSLLSGSFVVSGKACARLEKVGKDSYISKLTLQATKSKKGEQSEMIRSLNYLIMVMGIIIIPIGIALFVQSFIYNEGTFHDSITGMVAAIIGMIPEGLYLLTSVALAVSSVRLAQKKVLIHDMKCIETLAAMKGMITVHHFLQAANPVKRWVVLTGMRVAGKYEFMHGLVANPQPNPKCVQSSQKLEELYKTAVPLAVRLIEEYAENKPLGAEYQHTFGEN